MIVIRVDGIVAEGRHGANPGERDRPQTFIVDVELDVENEEDSMEDTADYTAVAETVRETIARTSYELLETVAYETARAVYGLPKVERASVVVHKPGAAKAMGVDDVSVQATVA
jgi:dihydroneopterin aldolase/2-amino-4-hydroxy-6-hydroxymethyldihydropteridine diphosphokinase